MKSPVFWLIALPGALALGLFGYVRFFGPIGTGGDSGPPVTVLVSEEEHRVTDAMLSQAAEADGQAAPPIRAPDETGVVRDLGGQEYAGRPVLVVFIKEGCPCSVGMQPFFNQLARAYAPSVGFLGVIDRQSEEARSWGRANQVPFPILADPDLAIVRAYGASNSAYVALIDKRHQIEKFWPGVSEGMLDDLNQRLARLAGIEPRPIDASEAPEDLYSGCPFDL